jgi:hypothetical protein
MILCPNSIFSILFILLISFSVLCPRAFDPDTLAQNTGRKTIRITTGVSSGVLEGSFSFSFLGSTVNIPANLNNFNKNLCGRTFSNLQAVDEATCELENVDETDGSGSYLVRFEAWSVGLYENNVYSHSGRPPVRYANINTID